MAAAAFLLAATATQAGTKPAFGEVAIGGSLPITPTFAPEGGVHGTLAFGLQPFKSTPEISLSVRGSYSRFFSDSPARWVRSLITGTGNFIFCPKPHEPQRWYLLLGAGFGRADQEFIKVTDPLGCIGVGAEVDGKKSVQYVVELRLNDLSNSTYGDLRYLSLSFGLKF